MHHRSLSSAGRSCHVPAMTAVSAESSAGTQPSIVATPHLRVETGPTRWIGDTGRAVP